MWDEIKIKKKGCNKIVIRTRHKHPSRAIEEEALNNFIFDSYKNILNWGNHCSNVIYQNVAED